ncbi:amidase [Paraburkholderia sediminicola]|uniref:amidase n=1 Tax=Paraburkholderia sediminicola TaxID=458836 RepID=UPI0038B71493
MVWSDEVNDCLRDEAKAQVAHGNAGEGVGGTVAHSLGVISRNDGKLRAWSHVAAFAECDELLSNVHAGPLTGTPFGVKDVIDVAGMPTRCGSQATSDRPAAFDACSVALLRRAGAVPIGKTVTAEYAFREPGPTCNPHDRTHTPGGSSSGSAAAVAAKMVPLALGTQTGGSMIRPAAYCGVVGFKPSFGAVFRDGLKVTCESLDVIGWYADSLELAATVLEVLTPFKKHEVDLRSRPLRIAIVESNPEHELEPTGLRALREAAERLRGSGIVCATAESFDGSTELNEVHRSIMEYELARSLVPVVWRNREQLSPTLASAIDRGLAIPDEIYLERRARQEFLRSDWDRMFGDADLILTPSAPGTSPKGLASTGSSAFNKVWSVLGWPCIHLPTGTADNGLPIGVQLVGKFRSDGHLLGAAKALHEILRA